MSNIEIWKDVVGFENLYQISNQGRVKSLLRINNYNRRVNEKILVMCPDDWGYLCIRLNKMGIGKTYKVHRLVGIHFVPNNRNLNQLNHIDKNNQNNNECNLEWVSNMENICHRYIDTVRYSNYTGVTYDKNRGLWKSAISFEGKTINLGRFKTELEAYEARCKFEKENGIVNKYL